MGLIFSAKLLKNYAPNYYENIIRILRKGSEWSRTIGL